jgi:hypothetical protein
MIGHRKAAPQRFQLTHLSQHIRIRQPDETAFGDPS